MVKKDKSHTIDWTHYSWWHLPSVPAFKNNPVPLLLSTVSFLWSSFECVKVTKFCYRVTKNRRFLFLYSQWVMDWCIPWSVMYPDFFVLSKTKWLLLSKTKISWVNAIREIFRVSMRTIEKGLCKGLFTLNIFYKKKLFGLYCKHSVYEKWTKWGYNPIRPVFSPSPLTQC